MSAYIANQYSNQAVVYGAVHGENKNENLNGTLVQNTVDTNFSVNANYNVKNCASGYVSGTYKDCWDGYNGFISLSEAPYVASNGYASMIWSNLGPIVWPDDGYVNANGTKASVGVREPTFFAPPSNDYLYVYYLDGSHSTHFGIKVARARISDIPTLGAHAFYSYSNGSFSQAALPAGFSAASISSFYSVKGPDATALFSDNPMRFAVASIKGTSEYLGVLEYQGSKGPWTVALTASTDLIHWSTPIPVAQNAGGWDLGNLHYPIFIDQSGWSNTSVDANSFYIEGTDSSANIHLIHLSVSVK